MSMTFDQALERFQKEQEAMREIRERQSRGMAEAWKAHTECQNKLASQLKEK